MTLYLDSAATTLLSPKDKQDYLYYIDKFEYNPSSIYKGGKISRIALEEGRKRLATKIGVFTDDIIFTSGGTEGNSIIIQGFFNNLPSNQEGVLITTNIEHPSVLNVALHIEHTKKNVHVYYLQVDNRGCIDYRDLISTLKTEIDIDKVNPNNILVSIQWANSEIGTCQNIPLIGEICKKYGVFFHSDAVQFFPHHLIGKEIEFLDAFTVSGHKFNSVKGTGFIYVNKRIRNHLSPILFGGNQENGLRPGTENVASWIYMVQKAMEIKDEFMEPIDSAFEKLEEMLVDNHIKYHINGILGIPILNITFPGISASNLIALLSEKDIYVSAGSACHSYVQEPSHVLKAIGLSDEEAGNTIRICWNSNIKHEEFDRFIEELIFNIKLLKEE